MSLPSLDQFGFHHVLADTQGPVLVLFTAPRCGSCRHWKQVLGEFGPREGLQVFEVDVQRDPGLAQEFSLFHLPALFLYLDGEFHAELQAEASPAALRRAIAERLTAPAQEAP